MCKRKRFTLKVEGPITVSAMAPRATNSNGLSAMVMAERSRIAPLSSAFCSAGSGEAMMPAFESRMTTVPVLPIWSVERYCEMRFSSIVTAITPRTW